MNTTKIAANRTVETASARTPRRRSPVTAAPSLNCRDTLPQALRPGPRDLGFEVGAAHRAAERIEVRRRDLQALSAEELEDRPLVLEPRAVVELGRGPGRV